MTVEDWATLTDQLAELERTNPEVRRAARDLERVKRQILRSPHNATYAGNADA